MSTATQLTIEGARLNGGVIEVSSKAVLATLQSKLPEWGYRVNNSSLVRDPSRLKASLTRVGKCMQCKRQFSLIALDLALRACPHCGTALFLPLTKPHASFFFGDEKVKEHKMLNVELLKLDRPQREIYFHLEFLQTIITGALRGVAARDHMNRFRDLWQLANLDRTQVVKMKYLPYRPGDIAYKGIAWLSCVRTRPLNNFATLAAPGKPRKAIPRTLEVRLAA